MINSKENIIFFTVCDEKEHAKEVIMKIKPSGYLVMPAKKEQLEAELKNLRYCAS